MRKKTMNTILITENSAELANFVLEKNKLQEKNFIKIPLSLSQPEESSQKIKSACQKNKIDLKEEFIVTIPRFQTTIKTFELPTMNLNEVDKMVNFQLQGSLPYKLEDLIVQNLIYPSSEEGYSRVISIIVKKELIDDILEIFRLSEIKFSKVDLNSTVLLNRFKMKHKRESSKDISLLINIENKSVDFVFINKGQILLSRGALLGQDDFKKNFISEVKRTILLFNRRYSDKIGLIFVWGRRLDLDIFANSISNQINLKVEVEKDENLLKSLAYCLRKDISSVNLLPKNVKRRQELFLKRSNFLKITSLLALIVLFLSSTFFIDFKQKRKHLTILNNQIKNIESETLEIQQKSKIIKSAQRKQKQTIQAIKVIAELYSITQPGIFFSSLSLTPMSVIIRGQAKGLDKVLEFVSRLESSTLFENVELKYTSKRRFKGKEITDFEVAFFHKSIFAGEEEGMIKLFKLNKRELHLLILCCIIVISVVSYITIIEPLLKRYKLMEGEMRDKQTKLARLRKTLLRKDAIEDAYQEILPRLSQSGSDEEKFAHFLKKVEINSRQSEIYITTMKPIDIIEGENEKEYLIRIEAEGKLRSLAEFLFNLAGSEQLISLKTSSSKLYTQAERFITNTDESGKSCIK